MFASAWPIVQTFLAMIAGSLAADAAASGVSRLLGKKALQEAGKTIASAAGEKVAATAAGKAVDAGLTAARSRLPQMIAKRLPTAAGIGGALVGGAGFLAHNAAFMGGMEAANAILPSGESGPSLNDWQSIASMPSDKATQQAALDQYSQMSALKQALQQYTGNDTGGLY